MTEPENTDPYVPGGIIESTWGHDQTNVDFYRIIKRSGDWLTLVLVPSVETYDPATMTGTTVPDPDTSRTISYPLRRKLHYRDGRPSGCAIYSYGWAAAWDGKPARFSTYA